MRWLFDPDEAARHPWRASGTVFALVWLGVALYAYFVWTHHNLLLAASAGVPFGLIVVAVCVTQIGQRRGWPVWISGPFGSVPRVPFRAAVLWGGVGVGLVFAAVTTGVIQLALAGFSLIALALLWHLIRRSVTHR
jgi:hypothetical protein